MYNVTNTFTDACNSQAYNHCFKDLQNTSRWQKLLYECNPYRFVDLSCDVISQGRFSSFSLVGAVVLHVVSAPLVKVESATFTQETTCNSSHSRTHTQAHEPLHANRLNYCHREVFWTWSRFRHAMPKCLYSQFAHDSVKMRHSHWVT